MQRIDEIIKDKKGLSIKEISDTTGIPRSTVQRYLQKVGYEYKRKAWNKGLTKEGDSSIESMSQKKKGKGYKHHPDTIEKISKSMKGKGGYREGSGNGNAYYYGEDVVSSDYELKIAKLMDEEGIKWEKSNHNNIIFKYTDKGIIRTVSVEFYLSEYDLYLAVKYHLNSEHRERLVTASTQNNIKLLIVDQMGFRRITYNSMRSFLKNSLQK